IEARPQVIITELTERVHPIQPTRTPVIAPVPAHRGGAVVPLGLAGLGVFLAGWLAIDAIGWISAAFERSTALGALAAAAVLAGVVSGPLDRRAQTHVRTAVLRAFGITAISPTALSDSLFFLACGVRMVRAIATCYGHRPTATATLHLLRRLVFEAGKLGAVDIASTTLMQHLGGAVTERVATSAADALYAAY